MPLYVERWVTIHSDFVYIFVYWAFNHCLNHYFPDIQTPRDAFITAICRSSLPPHYALSVLNMGYQFSGIISMSINQSNYHFYIPKMNL